MLYQFFNLRFCTTFITLFVILVAVPSLSSEHTAEKALVYTPEDEELVWAPCPEIFPESCELAVLQGNPKENNTDIFFKIPPDTKLVKHKHSSAERMALVSGELHVEYDGHEKQVLKPGTYAYGPPELPHKAYCAEGDEPCVLFIAFVLPIDVEAVGESTEE